MIVSCGLHFIYCSHTMDNEDLLLDVNWTDVASLTLMRCQV